VTLPSKGQEPAESEGHDPARELEAAVEALLSHVEPAPKGRGPSRWVASDDETTAPDSLY